MSTGTFSCHHWGWWFTGIHLIEARDAVKFLQFLHKSTPQQRIIMSKVLRPETGLAEQGATGPAVAVALGSSLPWVVYHPWYLQEVQCVMEREPRALQEVCPGF